MNKIMNCNICGGKIKDKYEVKFKDIIGVTREYTQCISICSECGFIFTKNPLDEETLNDEYKENAQYEFDSDNCLDENRDDYKLRCARQKSFLERNIERETFKSILEVGAASGYNLSLYKSYEVLGIEPSRRNCINAEKKYQVNMFCGTFDEFCKAENEKKVFDLIFLSHVLEHIVNPYEFIKECEKINSKYIFIEVPTFDYKFIDEPYAMFNDQHVNIFTLESLQNIMNRCGYSLLEAEMFMGRQHQIPAGYPAISTIWEKSQFIEKHIPLHSSEEQLDAYLEISEKQMIRINSIIDDIPEDMRIAVWRIGRHASMLLANSKLGEKNIVAAYDSDKSKQNKKFNGINIQAFDESDVINHKIDAVIITTYAARRIIEKILDTYKQDIQIIDLYDNENLC